ncbi:flagellar hook-basal body complex protein FliE [Litoribacillus peritrichatus]|uniref:Flagellar hook-basal body complex protein FliE n=1 Tax=Litoribacillus peritrichatus TaxID=718191 RepID=A0ABP7M495_9GAMM
MEVRSDISQVLSQMRQMKSQVQDQSRTNTEIGQVMDVQKPGNVEKDDAPEFSQLLKMAVDQVNETQKAAGALATAYEKGDPTVDIPDVMIASQKASVAFQAMTQVRNKLISAYEDIMKMPI